jgi:hypothetical protein
VLEIEIEDLSGQIESEGREGVKKYRRRMVNWLIVAVLLRRAPSFVNSLLFINGPDGQKVPVTPGIEAEQRSRAKQQRKAAEGFLRHTSIAPRRQLSQ